MSVLNTLYQHAVSSPNKFAVLGPRDESLTYSQLYECVVYLANYFNLEVLKSSLKTKRPRVCVLINDPVCNILIVLGLNFIGAEIVTLNPKLKSAQIEAFFKFTDAEYIFTDDEGAENLRFSAIPFQNVIEAAKSQIKKKDTVLQISQKPEYNLPYGVDTPFLITLSSGSTGEPKPVIVTEKNKIDRTAQAVDLYGISSHDVILNASPFFHSLGQRLTFVPILTGATLVLLERFSVSRWIKSVESFGVTFTIAVSSTCARRRPMRKKSNR